MKHKTTVLTQAKFLRKNMTPQETKLWNLLRNRNLLNLKFRRQVPIGTYVADFVCEAKNLVIEIDGGQHNTNEIADYDKKRTDFLQQKGYKVIRFWNNEIDENIDGVIDVIVKNIG